MSKPGVAQPTGAGSKRLAEQEADRVERMLHNRRARVADAERKLAAARERLKAAKR